MNASCNGNGTGSGTAATVEVRTLDQRFPVTSCPRCGAAYDARGFVQEYWTSERRVFSCWCASCHFVCDVVVVDRVLAFEPEH